MNQISTFTNDERPWLRAVHEKKKTRSVQLGKSAIDSLVKEGKPVTLNNIHNRSKELDPTGKGIHPNTIKTNEELFDYYKQHSHTHKQRQTNKPPSSLNMPQDTHLRRINPNRNLVHLRQKYMKLTKQELVARLIQAEQFIAENQTKWTASMFEQFS
ncbi:hypothetical protein [Brevibacillus choshinensis]|uniref:Transposase n=1 Tax=Brevibacillus choshinensis TaxID=54911 RepID=A0ABX7FQ15_BRECH|nr:hypothetical protein [Brevibacillus choshinensis]QRG67401.1 hypothetical protein JNE38_28870 [Brevibacillus choshinensis]